MIVLGGVELVAKIRAPTASNGTMLESPRQPETAGLLEGA